ncbi:PepSY-like domain-containing protein [uncultured Bacteroides sp.]|uniref:PepSY-like domain-containing protein n=1 Tax=uncultured Bacteroides sp. TaxID=162156 RepID=UPI0025CE57DD|nr:PepSY-like domain-containing protein [uncultured Bacteroides sp.]
MKKVLSVLVLALAAVQFAFAGDVITQDTKRLPLAARNFINQYFAKQQVSRIKIETGMLGSKKYEVSLANRTEIDFDGNGNWTEVDCDKTAVPEALVPVSVREYVKRNFPQEVIVKIERERSGMEVELGNDYSLKFNSKGKFVSMDD